MTLLDITIKLPSHTQFKMHWLADSTFLSKIFATEIIELEPHNHQPRRLVNMRGHQFTEKITHLSDTKLEYQIEGKGPVKHHQGEINYVRSSNNNGCESNSCDGKDIGDYLHYQIHGQSNTWVPTWLLKIVLTYDFTLAAKRLRKLLNER